MKAKPKLLSAQDRTDALSFCLFSSLWLLHFFLLSLLNLIDLHLPSYLLSPYNPSAHSALLLTIHPQTLFFLRRVAGVCWEKLSRPWEPPQTTGATQKTGLRSAECDKAPETVVYNCSFFTPYWWFVPIRKYVSNSYTFMNMDQCGSFVLSTQWLQSSTSLLGDDILARQMLGF